MIFFSFFLLCVINDAYINYSVIYFKNMHFASLKHVPYFAQESFALRCSINNTNFNNIYPIIWL